MRRPWLPASKISLSRRLSSVDVALAVMAPVIAFSLRETPGPDDRPALIYVLLAVAFSIVFFRRFHVAHGLSKYFSFHDATQIAKAAACAVTATSIVLFTLTRLEQIPRSIPPLHFLILTATLIGARLARRDLAQRQDKGATEPSHGGERSVIIVGASRLAWFYIRLLDTFAGNNRRVAAILDDDPALHGRSIYGHLIVGGVEEAAALLEDLAQHGVDVIGFVICEQERARVTELCDRLQPLARERGLTIEAVASQIGAFSDEAEAGPAAHGRMPSIAEGPAYLRMKRVIEPLLAALLFVALSPLFALATTLVAIGLGSPILFWQRRIGRHGQPIYIYKFKSLRNPVDIDGRVLEPGERITATGQFLRASKLDELPQLYNVIIGEMGLVGPRPLLLADQPDGPTSRLNIAPGLTGWAQIHGGKLVTVEEKNALDGWYVGHASLRLDLFIVFRTLVDLVVGERRDEKRLAAALARATRDAKPASAKEKRRRTPADAPGSYSIFG